MAKRRPLPTLVLGLLVIVAAAIAVVVALSVVNLFGLDEFSALVVVALITLAAALWALREEARRKKV
jgi:lipopolysaccharide export LptBFGC system permease protein LptF